MFKEVIQIYRYKQGFIARGMSDGGAETSVGLCDIRAAIIEPILSNPCYYIVCGVLDKENEHGKRPVLFVTEYEDVSTAKVFLKLADDITRLSIQTVYANYHNEVFYSKVWRLGSGANIKPAVSVNNILYGDALVSEYIRLNALITTRGEPKPVMAQQVNTINTAGYSDKPEYDKFYAWNALRYILAGFERTPPAQIGRQAYNDIGNPAKWDSRPSGLGAKFHNEYKRQWAV